MEIQDIQTFFQDPDANYELGIRLYLTYGTYPNLIRNFARQGKTPYNVQMMKEQLRNSLKIRGIAWEQIQEPVTETPISESAILIETPSLVEEPSIDEVFTKISTIQKGQVKREDLPADLQVHWDLKELLFKEASHLHAQLEHLAETEAKAAAKTILGNFDVIQLIWKEIDVFLATGEFKPLFVLSSEPKKEIETNPFVKYDSMSGSDLQKAKTNTRTSITKWKKKPDNESKLLELTNQLNYIEEKIKLVNPQTDNS